ncbi:ABC transporter ATP-binding protein [Bacillus sp. FJAT-29790]|uniref:ABC transporter ATP-binding protein n=1 Tax=Bacillus sp. FJAT-29790 TaxID=1895002 RepID=UPI001C24DA0D|nr:ABC transporter ATP-binding protein [Bacillus sp. FJAT-29790]MBU8881341.1 ABC transporter ATP-binding protein [Bacillus sp. FJAT-29790]
MTDVLLEIKDLKTHFYTETGQVTAVKGVSFDVKKGEILGVVGESGCGKSVMSQTILRLFEKGTVEYEGEINFKGTNLLSLSNKQMNKVRGNDISMIFQDPLSTLNPVHTVGRQIAESIILHQNVSKKDAEEKAIELLKLVGIPSPERRAKEFPHNLSGGMRQRAMIAVALACRPQLLIADEPTTALDVTIQAQILDLMKNLNEELDMGIIFITHDLGVVAELCSRVVVMYLGEIVEEASIEELFSRPLHPYTQGLIKSIPQLDGDRSALLHTIEGTVPPLTRVPKGCRFASRCPFADEQCIAASPPVFEHTPSQKVKCWHFEKILAEKEVAAGVHT